MQAIHRSIYALSLAAVLGLALPQTGFTQDAKPDPESVVITIGETEVTEMDLAVAGEDFAEIVADVPEDQKREKLIELLVDMHIFAQEAKKNGLADGEEFAVRIKLMEARALRNAYFEQEILSTVTDEEVKARYEAEIGKITPEENVSARHILVKEEDEAKKLIEELQGGADFETLAKEHSTGPSGPGGGDLGQFGRGQMVPAFEAVAFSLEKDSISTEPVRTQFGWHIIQVYDKGSAPLPAFEQVGEQVRSMVVSERFTEKLTSLRDTYEVKRAE